MREISIDRFPWADWILDIGGARLKLKGPWKFDPEEGVWFGSYQIQESAIPGTTETQIEAWRPGRDIAVMRIGPENDWVDTDFTSYPKEATLTLYLSRKRWYDCFVDLSVNRLADPAKPKFVTFLRGDGFLVPSWNVQYRKDSGAYEDLLTCNPEGDDHRFVAHKGSVAQKLSDIWTPTTSLNLITDSGMYYLDGASPDAPLAENGVITVAFNPYSANEGMMEWQSFVDRTHRYVRVKVGGVWGAWGLIAVA